MLHRRGATSEGRKNRNYKSAGRQQTEVNRGERGANKEKKKREEKQRRVIGHIALGKYKGKNDAVRKNGIGDERGRGRRTVAYKEGIKGTEKAAKNEVYR